MLLGSDKRLPACSVEESAARGPKARLTLARGYGFFTQQVPSRQGSAGLAQTHLIPYSTGRLLDIPPESSVLA